MHKVWPKFVVLGDDALSCPSHEYHDIHSKWHNIMDTTFVFQLKMYDKYTVMITYHFEINGVYLINVFLCVHALYHNHNHQSFTSIHITDFN